jgi:hypothetical protein
MVDNTTKLILPHCTYGNITYLNGDLCTITLQQFLSAKSRFTFQGNIVFTNMVCLLTENKNKLLNVNTYIIQSDNQYSAICNTGENSITIQVMKVMIDNYNRVNYRTCNQCHITIYNLKDDHYYITANDICICRECLNKVVYVDYKRDWSGLNVLGYQLVNDQIQSILYNGGGDISTLSLCNMTSYYLFKTWNNDITIKEIPDDSILKCSREHIYDYYEVGQATNIDNTYEYFCIDCCKTLRDLQHQCAIRSYILGNILPRELTIFICTILMRLHQIKVRVTL